MRVEGVSMSLANINTQNRVGTAVLRKAMDTNEEMGNKMVEMIDAAAMEQSVHPYIGGNFDMRV